MDFHRYACNLFLAYLNSIQNYVLYVYRNNVYLAKEEFPSLRIETIKKDHTVYYEVYIYINSKVGNFEGTLVTMSRGIWDRNFLYDIPEHNSKVRLI